jgi:hypothetical protein
MGCTVNTIGLLPIQQMVIPMPNGVFVKVGGVALLEQAFENTE